MSIQDILFLIGWWLFVALVIACSALVVIHLTWGVIPYEKRHKAYESFNKAWGDFTMSVGVAIIGDRETATEMVIKAERNEAITECSQLKSWLKSTATERDEAIKERDAIKNKWLVEQSLRKEFENALNTVVKKHNRLQKRFKTLSDSNPKRKRK